jgi:PmbA protein
VHTDPERLLGIADAVLADAAVGEQVEVYVARSTTTAVRGYGGEVESLTNAEVSGVGVRLINAGRMGFAHAGGLDVASARECVAEARDNARFAEPDEFVGLVEGADSGTPIEIDRWSETLAGRSVDAKIAAALELEALTLGADPRISGVRSAVYSDAGGESALVSTTGVRRWSRANRCSMSVVALAADGAGDATVGWANDSSREPAELDCGQLR